jgi:DNA-binding MarR family transcriptional regulator
MGGALKTRQTGPCSRISSVIYQKGRHPTGLTETSPDPEDGRRLVVSLTRAGQQLVEKAAPNALAISRETLAPLDAKEREMLVALLSKLR